jgi:hypothetical protein
MPLPNRWTEIQLAAHVAYSNDVFLYGRPFFVRKTFFCTEDQGKSASGGSILDADDRLWLAVTYNVKFATIGELATQIRSART